MGKAYLIKKSDGSFLPAYESDHEAMKGVKVGDPIEVSWSRPRSYGNHKRFFAMLNCTVQNMPETIPDRFTNVNFLRDELLMACGYCDIHVSLSGKESFMPKSMSFKSMNENEFKELYTAVSNYILKYFLKGLDEKTFEENVNLFM